MVARTILRVVLFASLAVRLAPAPVLAGSIAILETLVSDNGDNDGFADTKETITLRLRVQNLVGSPLTDVALHLTTDEYALACVSNATIFIGDMAVGEIVETVDGFDFYLADIDRAGSGLGPYDDLSVGFDLSATAGSPASDPGIEPTRLRLDLDLDISGGSGPTTFLEQFEAGMGAFEVQNLDQGKADPVASEGYRCSYHNPDWVNSHIYGSPGLIAECYLAASPLHSDQVFWGLSGPETSPAGGRGFTGFHSMFFGLDLGPPQNWTTPVAVLEAAATAQPIHLGWDDVSPTLTIKQQVSLLDERIITQVSGSGESLDRAVVMVQVADGLNDPAGSWLKLDPYQNVYDQQGTDNFFNCTFDPTDDGNDEDSFFDPTDPSRLHGPSSTCWPERVFANIGQATEPFAVGNVGRADGPGLQGIWGIGTWIESKFDMSRFRGRSVRLRFLTTALQAVPHETWEDYFLSNSLEDNPVTGDDGWWIDNVEVTGALSFPASVSADVKDNSGLPGPPGGDSDSDGLFDVCDNCDQVDNPGQADLDHDGFAPASNGVYGMKR